MSPVKPTEIRDAARFFRTAVSATSSKAIRDLVASLPVVVEDEGIGQPPGRMHATLLSLGRSDKPDKPYLIGVFGQGGSSAYAASEYSWIMSRRVPELLDGAHDGIGWTVIKRIVPAGRRDV